MQKMTRAALPSPLSTLTVLSEVEDIQYILEKH